MDIKKIKLKMHGSPLQVTENLRQYYLNLLKRKNNNNLHILRFPLNLSQIIKLNKKKKIYILHR